MDKPARNEIQLATQVARRLLEDAYREQLEGTFDILLDGTIAGQPGSHLSERQKVTREKLVATVAHKQSAGLKAKEAVDAYLREAAFTTLNRFVALKMLEARDLVQECVSKGEDSSGFKEFTALAPGLVAIDDKGYRLYLEMLFDEIGQEVKVLFDPRDVASLLWPERQTLLELLGILNAPELASVWAEDETIGWVYQYFNGDEERKKMRAESDAPRNSRELAVRNQFFTPRYVVQFLTDNTLGRTWYEMMQGETKLADLDYLVRRTNEVFLAEGESAPESGADGSELSQEELIQQTVHVPFRAKKDPRDLRILDPACGSGHFLLYTFDLLITIFEEAWADAGAAAFTETGTQLRADFESIEDLRRVMPKLILRHNLHGVDIDPRAAQIAAMALWMRAQRAYNQFEVDRAQRPPITKTNIVVAEPMPGDAELVDEFAASLKPAVLGDLFKKMVEEMKLAGELGSLLKIEESIAKAVKEAAEANQQGNLFAEKVERQDFWDTADEKIIAALGSFAESAAGAGGVRRQLFAGDAAQGVAFIELMRLRFDMVLMNPPFGAGSQVAKSVFESNYPRTKNDVYAAFIERSIALLRERGTMGAITSRTGFFLSRFERWRTGVLLKEAPPHAVADLGYGVMDAMVEAAAYCLTKEPHRVEQDAVFLRVIESRDKAEALLVAVKQKKNVPGWQRFDVNPSKFVQVPRAPFTYWVSDHLLGLFTRLHPFENDERTARVGLQTSDDFRWVCAWWEAGHPDQSGAFPIPFVKGGAYSPFYSDVHLCVRWGSDGRYLKETKADELRRGKITANNSKCWNEHLYLRPGLTWPRRGASFSAQQVPRGAIFSDGKMAAFVRDDDLGFFHGLFNSSIFGALIRLQSDAVRIQFQCGLIQRVPVPVLDSPEVKVVAASARRAWSLLRSLDTVVETSHAFVLPALLQAEGTSLRERAAAWEKHHRAVASEIVEAQRIVDTACFNLYSINEPDRCAISTNFGREASASQETVEDPSNGLSDLVVELVSWAVGTAMGRFDGRLALGTRPFPPEPEPFDTLPAHSPGMLVGEVTPFGPANDGERAPTAGSGILVDDEGHTGDVIGSIRSVFQAVFSSPQQHWLEAADVLDAGKTKPRNWIARRYFEYHLGQYSKSRRKAPIYWQLATPSGSYSVWCYYHYLTRDTFFRVANDYVTPKVDHEERKLNTLRQEAGPDPSSKQRKEMDSQETFVAELRAFAAEVTRIAPLWKPNLNDGVIINFAPLWRLVPQHKPWQKECKACWDRLCDGDYDWAHLAMHLWPERVVPRCQGDRSLAIAHGLEDDFWYEDEDGKWQKRQNSDGRIEALVTERASTAVEAALKDLLQAPAAVGQSRRKRRAKA